MRSRATLVIGVVTAVACMCSAADNCGCPPIGLIGGSWPYTVPETWSYDFVEDFRAYEVGETIHDAGEVEPGIPRWQVQRNSIWLGDPGWVRVVIDETATKRGVLMTNRDLDGEVDTIYASMSMWDCPILNQGTIYIRYADTGPNDTVVATNDQYPGWDYYVAETGDSAAPSFQGTAAGPGGYADQASLVELGGGELFRARDGDAYDEVAPMIPVETWHELWIHVDMPGDRVRYYIAEAGGEPEVMLTAEGSEWWAHRNTDVASVENIKFFIGGFDPAGPFPETSVLIDLIAVNTQEHVLASLTGEPPRPVICDPNGDGWIDLDDFMILKNNFGTASGATCSEADMDGDGDVDLDDFMLLKMHFGQQVWPPDI